MGSAAGVSIFHDPCAGGLRRRAVLFGVFYAGFALNIGIPEDSAMTEEHDDHDHGHSQHDHSHHDHAHGHAHAPHDWHSQAYVDHWIKRDEGRDDERRPRIRQMIAMAKLPPEEPLAALDIGAGYGFVTEEVLHAFPKARVTLQDFSELMLARARQHLSGAAGQLSFVLADLTDPNWSDRVGGPFDLIVSAIAIHNLRSRETIAACYRGIAGLLKPGAQFLDYDLFRSCGGIETHIAMMQEAGMTRVSCAWDDGHATIIAAHGRRVF
jgi:SAM-dependent methyltransferase